MKYLILILFTVTLTDCGKPPANIGPAPWCLAPNETGDNNCIYASFQDCLNAAQKRGNGFCGERLN